MRRRLWCLSALIAVLAMETASADAEILIGMAGALTGPNAYQGEQQQQGVEMAIADLNANGGLMGQRLRLISVDDACDSGQAVDRKSTRLNSSHANISYAVFCLKKI